MQQCNLTYHFAPPDPNHNIWHIREECIKMYDRYDSEYQQLMTELVQQYKKERLAEKISESIKIYVRSNNPNDEYRIVKGKGPKGFIGERILMEQQLITDGTVAEMESKDSYGEDYIYGYDAFQYEKGTVVLSLVDAIAKRLLVSDATFAIIRYFEENELLGAHIHTKEQDLERLIALAKLSIERDVKEKTKVYTLTR